MLENLTKKLVADDVARGEKEIMIEGSMIPSKMSQIERYSLITESVDCEDVKAVLNNIRFDEMDTFEGRAERLYEACMNPQVVSESIQLEKADKIKRLTMKKEDYDKIVGFIKSYNTGSDDTLRKASLSKIKSFIGTINSNITKADEVDTFISSAIRQIYTAVCGGRAEGGSDKSAIIVNLKAIKAAIK